MMNRLRLLVVCGLITMTSCIHSSMPQKELTRVIVPRVTVQTKDTIMSRLGIEIEKIDSIVATAPRKEVEILDLTGEDTVNTVVAKVEPKVEKPKVESKIEPKVVQKEQPKAEPKVVQKEQPRAEPKAPLNYHVIVASFPKESLAEAEKYVARLKKETSGAKLVVTESRVRVAYSSHPSMAIATEARDALAETQSKYKDCWVLKRVL